MAFPDILDRVVDRATRYLACPKQDRISRSPRDPWLFTLCLSSSSANYSLHFLRPSRARQSAQVYILSNAMRIHISPTLTRIYPARTRSHDCLDVPPVTEPPPTCPCFGHSSRHRLALHYRLGTERSVRGTFICFQELHSQPPTSPNASLRQHEESKSSEAVSNRTVNLPLWVKYIHTEQRRHSRGLTSGSGYSSQMSV